MQTDQETRLLKLDKLTGLQKAIGEKTFEMARTDKYWNRKNTDQTEQNTELIQKMTLRTQGDTSSLNPNKNIITLNAYAAAILSSDYYIYPGCWQTGIVHCKKSSISVSYLPFNVSKNVNALHWSFNQRDLPWNRMPSRSLESWECRHVEGTGKQTQFIIMPLKSGKSKKFKKHTLK